MVEETPNAEQISVRQETVPVRGSLRLQSAASSERVAAGSDFSIFLTIQNPFDVPISVYQVETHIPVELMDVNTVRIERAREEAVIRTRFYNPFYVIGDAIRRRIQARRVQTGVAIAVGTNFAPEAEKDIFHVRQHVETLAEGGTAVGVQLNFPENPTSEELDAIFRRIEDYKKGLIPVQLQPGDSIVKQFVLRTRRWLFFTPLSHTFQIQVNYSVDGVDHSDTIPFQLNIASTIMATTLGGIAGAILGSLLKTLTSTAGDGSVVSIISGLATAVLASTAVVVAFSRKTTAQPMVSVEDFWGGALIGISVGYFGFEQFSGLFSSATGPNGGAGGT